MKMDYKKWIKWTLTALLIVAVTVGFIPQMAAPAHADDGYNAIQLVTDGNAANIQGAQVSNVWFGNYKQSSDGNGGYNLEPIEWRVLSNSDGLLFLLADQNLDCKIYNEGSTSVAWETSTIRTWLNGDFKDSAFSTEETAAIAKTDVVNANKPLGGNNTEDKIFLLSIDEAKNEKYGFTTDNNDTPIRAAKNTDYTKEGTSAWTSSIGNGDWWLRSPGKQEGHAAIVTYHGNLNSDQAVGNATITVRPAFNFNLESVLFTSAAEGGKSSDAEGVLNEVGTTSGNKWKVTLQSGHKDFEILECRSTENGVTVKYKGAAVGTAGKSEYISAVITDKPVTDSSAKITYYGRIQECTSESDTVTINTAGKLEDGDMLYVFNEQYNSDKKTDYASALQEVTLTKPKLTITAKDQTYEYNGQTQGEGDTVYGDPAQIAEKVTVEGLQDGDELTSIVVDGQGTEVGTYDITLSGAAVNGVSAAEKYDVRYVNGTLTITGKPSPPSRTSIDNAPVVLDDAPLIYTGQPVTPVIKTIGGRTLEPDRDYTVRYTQGDTLIEAPTDAGTYTMTITGKGNFAGSTSTEFTIEKADGTLTATGNKVKAKSKTVKLKKAKKISAEKAYTIEGAIGELAFSKVKANKKAGKFKVNATTGQIKVKKGLKKGRYELTVLISDAGDKNHEIAEAKAIVKIRIRK